MRIARSSSLVFHAVLALVLGVGVAVVGAQTVAGGAWFGAVPVVAAGWLGLRGPWRRWRLAQAPFPAPWRAWLDDAVPFYRRLDAAGRRRFERDVRFFIGEQTFEAVGAVDLSDDLKLAVGAGAALLLHGRPDWELGRRRTILFYPDAFDEDYLDTEYASYDGMVHAQGPVILSVRSVLDDWSRPGSGHNVVLHELAHLFDMQDAYAEGVPSLMDRASADAWMRLVRLEMRKARIGRSLLRRYAATNPAEFFAVAVENFFDRPDALRARHGDLFYALVSFFNLDPSGGAAADDAGEPGVM